MIVCKQFTFHAAHRLDHHEGQCKDLHGHSYKLEIAVKGPRKQWVSGYPAPDEGMVVDFDLLKEFYKSEIEPDFEHKYLNESVAPQMAAMGCFRVKPGYQVQTTAENLARYVWQVLHSYLGSDALADKFEGVEVAFIRLWETPTSYVEV